jgi:hypothetical protein
MIRGREHGHTDEHGRRAAAAEDRATAGVGVRQHMRVPQLIIGSAAIAAFVGAPGLRDDIFVGLVRIGTEQALTLPWCSTDSCR